MENGQTRSARNIRKYFWIALLLLGSVLACTVAINIYILREGRGRLLYEVSELPNRDVGLVLGTDLIRPNGTTNLHFLNRTTAAVTAYHAGKVRRLLISGSPNNRGFNEVKEMQKVLVENGVPPEAIELDSGGLRTWDSARNAAKNDHLKTVLVITDGFHAPRSIFLCHHFGMDAVAYCGEKEPASFWLFRCQAREYFARVKAFMDICLK